MASSKVKTLYIALGITASAAILKLAYSKYQQSRSKRSKVDGDPHESIALLKPLFQEATQRAKSLSLDQNDQLMLYGLYKQANVGDVNIKEPSRLNIVGRKKFEAWGKFKNMPQHFAMMKYVEVVEHFAAESGNTSDNIGAGAGAENAILDMMDDSDIVYEDESSVDLSESDDDDEALDLGNQMAIGSKQSTLSGGSAVPQTFDGKMSIMQAASCGDTEMLQQVIDSGADVNEQDEIGQTALHMAADKGNIECVSILLAASADSNATDKEGISVLEAAVIGGYVEAVKLLLDAGADPDHKDMDGDTPRSCAEDDDDENMKSLLRAAKRLDDNVNTSIQSEFSC